MPRVKEVKSLREICKNYIRNSLTNWFDNVFETTAENTTDLLAIDKNEHLNKCFETFLDLLPSTLLWSLFQTHGKPLSQRNSFLWGYLRMLITREQTVIYKETKEIVCGLLDIASKRFPKLKTLKIVEVTENINFCVTSNIHRFQKLQKLSLWHSDVGDGCLIYVGIFLRDLRDLDVRGCTKVTDVGIAGLCVNVEYSEKEMFGKCKSIRKLRVFQSSVSQEGIKIALRNLPALQECDGVSVQLLTEMHLSDFLSQKLLSMPKYSLTVLDILPSILPHSSFHYISSSLELIAFLCPSLTRVNVGSIGLREERELLSLSVLERLSELKIFLDKQLDILTFNDGLVPLLNVKGNSLTSLELVNLSQHPFDINLSTVIELCPNLVSLQLWHNSYSTSSRQLEESVETIQRNKRIKLDEDSKFEKLKKLVLWGDVPPANWITLLSSTALTEIKIQDCDTLTDYVLQKAVKANKFSNLQKLELFECNSD